MDNLPAVMDAVLGRLSAEDLLVELLERVRSILEADTCITPSLRIPANSATLRALPGGLGGAPAACSGVCW